MVRFAVVFGILGVVLAALACRLAREAVGAWWLVALIEAYLAACLLLLALAYGLRHGGLPVEDVLGHPAWSPLLRVLLMPYLALGATTLYLSRRVGSEDLMSPVASGLFIGRLPFPSERRLLERAGITAVLNLCWEFPRLSGAEELPGVAVARVPVLDGCPPTHRQFREAVARVAAWRAEGRVVLIHCAQGHGRSATVAAAVLARLGLASGPDDALGTILASRPRATPSGGQRAAFARFLAAP